MPRRNPSIDAAPTAPSQEVGQIAALRTVHTAFKFLHNQEMEFRRWQRELAEIPAPPFGEAARSEWLQGRFIGLGLKNVHADELGSVFGLLHENHMVEDQTLVGLSAHLDTVFPPGTNLESREEGNILYGPGISDNAAGVVAVLAIAAALKQSDIQPATNVVFVGNVGEEGEGNLRGMRHIFSSSPWNKAMGSLLVVDGAGADSYVTHGLGSRRFEITFRGPGGHSWSDFGIPNPIVLLARALSCLDDAHVPESPRTTFNVGVIRGGTSVNSIPESATASVDLRSTSMDELRRLENFLRDAVSDVWNEVPLPYRTGKSSGSKVNYTIECIGDPLESKPPPSAPAATAAARILCANGSTVRIATSD